MALLWRVEIDLQQSNEWTDITTYVQEASWRLGMSQAFQQIADDATCTLKLKNDEGVFNPENTGSPLYPYLLPQRRIRVIAERQYPLLVPDDIIQYLKLAELAGTTANDSSAENNDGTYSAGVTLDAADSPIEGDRMPNLDGDDHIDLYSAGLAADFDPDEGSMVFWVKAANSGVWTDGVVRVLARMRADDNNNIRVFKSATNGQLIFRHGAGGTVNDITINDITTTSEFCVVVTWSKSAGRIRFYMDGELVGELNAALGTFAGSLSNTSCVLGAGDTSGTSGWNGYLSHYRLYDRELTANEAATLAIDGDQQMYIGWIKDIDPDYNPAGAYTGKTLAQITCEGMKHLLDSTTVDLSVYMDATGDEVVADVIDSAGLPPGTGGAWRLGIAGSSEIGTTTFLADITDYLDAETGVTVFPTLADGENESNGMAAIKMVTEGERGHFFMDRDGKAVWWNRHHLLTITTSVLTINNTGSYKPVNVDYEWTNRTIYNVIRAKAHPRSTVAGATLWALSTPITIDPTATVVFECALRDADGKFVGAESVSASGTTFSSGTATITIETLGNRARVTIENLSASVSAVLTALNLMGDGLQDRNTIEAVVEDQASINAYQRRELPLSLRALTTFEAVETIAKFELARRKDARANVKAVDFLNAADDIANAHQLNLEIGSRVTLTLSNGHDSDHFIMGEQHTVKFPGVNPIHKTRFYLEPAGNNDYWVLGVSTLGENTTLAY